MKLDINNPAPLHIQLKEILKYQIREGYFSEKIPSERMLMEQYDVSRSTVREAVSNLVQEGMLQKIHGKGTFVSSKPLQDRMWITSFTENIKKMDIRLLKNEMMNPPFHLMDKEGYSKTCFIKRLRLKKDKPIAVESHYYPQYFRQLLDQYDLNSIILYDMLEKELGFTYWEAEQTISGTHPSKDDAAYLKVPRSACMLKTERWIYDQKGMLIEYYEGLFRADLYSFNMKISQQTMNHANE